MKTIAQRILAIANKLAEEAEEVDPDALLAAVTNPFLHQMLDVVRREGSLDDEEFAVLCDQAQQYPQLSDNQKQVVYDWVFFVTEDECDQVEDFTAQGVDKYTPHTKQLKDIKNDVKQLQLYQDFLNELDINYGAKKKVLDMLDGLMALLRNKNNNVLWNSIAFDVVIDALGDSDYELADPICKFLESILDAK